MSIDEEVVNTLISRASSKEENTLNINIKDRMREQDVPTLANVWYELLTEYKDRSLDFAEMLLRIVGVYVGMSTTTHGQICCTHKDAMPLFGQLIGSPFLTSTIFLIFCSLDRHLTYCQREIRDSYLQFLADDVYPQCCCRLRDRYHQERNEASGQVATHRHPWHC